MSIIFNENSKTITLNTTNTSYQMKIGKYGYLFHLYYGKRLNADMSYLIQYYDRGFSGNPEDAGEDRTFSLDALPQEFPVYGNGDYRDNAFLIKDAAGAFGCDLRYESHRIDNTKKAIPGLPSAYADKNEIETLVVTLADKAAAVEVELYYSVFEKNDVITRSVAVKNTGNKKLFIDRIMSCSMDILGMDADFITFNGRHGNERILERTPLGEAALSIGSRRGTSSHQHNPFFIVCDKKADEDYGNAYAFMLLYSGNFMGEGFREQYGSLRLMMGIQPDMFEYPLEPGKVFYSPEAAMSFSADGFAELSHSLHNFIKNNIIRNPENDGIRPVLVNSWEAAFFDFNSEKILKLADDAKELGVEMLVLDDGWFGHRDDDCSSLGDWYVNEEKLGCSMGELADRIHEKGLKFGLWIEPEMISEDSRLYKEHPDWAYRLPWRSFIRSRSQLVLDFSRKEIVDHIFNSLTEVIDNAKIDYIKMDMNRSITDVYSNCGVQNYGTIMHNYCIGVYDFIERLRNRYPEILIEGCSGGGGRFDAGMLYYTPQIWTSDNTDAIERIKIQYGTSFAYPPVSMGAHVSIVPNQQTGRVVPMKTRTAVALSGTFGYELDLGLLSEEEKEEVRQGISDYHKYYRIIRDGLYFRLTDPMKESEFAAWESVAENGDEALVTVVTLDSHCNSPVNYVKFKGLNPDKDYKDENSGNIYNGAALMNAGWPIPIIPGEYNSFVLHLIAK